MRDGVVCACIVINVIEYHYYPYHSNTISISIAVLLPFCIEYNKFTVDKYFLSVHFIQLVTFHNLRQRLLEIIRAKQLKKKK